jgi:hypothetical protein
MQGEYRDNTKKMHLQITNLVNIITKNELIVIDRISY